MRATLTGVSGTLLPVHYLEEQLPGDAAPLMGPAGRGWSLRKFDGWWREVERTCGPASGLRTLFDAVAMPLFAMLGFRASQATFARDRCTVILETPAGTPVALLLLPWAERPAALWRDVAMTARAIGASWSFVLAPPFLSLVDARGWATRRSLDFSLPDVVTDQTLDVLRTLAHADAFDGATERRAPRLETLVHAGAEYQARVRSDLQHGVTDALGVLTSAIKGEHELPRRTSQPRTAPILDAAPSTIDRSPPAEAEALTLIYRILFLLFAESRRLLPGEDPTYRSAYAMSQLCREALRGEPRFGLWDALAAATRLSRAGCRSRALTVHPFNGHLFARQSAPSLEWRSSRHRRQAKRQSREEAMHHALVVLGSRPGRAGREPISYRDLGVEQLGAVYEHLLDGPVEPRLAPGARGPLGRQHSARRKETGTFYTPRSLAEFVVRRTLAPLVAGASADAILALRIVDPAMGSGAFLVAACRYLAAAYAQALVDEGRASPDDLNDAEHAAIRRRIAERCLIGVDRNPVAVQLARLSLWLTTLAGGKPLSFLDHRLRVGDSLIGASPEDLRASRPGRRSASSNSSRLPLFDEQDLEDSIRRFVRPFGELLARHDDTVADVKRKEAVWHGLVGDTSALHPWRLAASLWCARFFWPETNGEPPAPSEFRALVDCVVRGDRTLSSSQVSARIGVARTVAEARCFLHWPFEFPDVFYDEDGSVRPRPGFDAVIGNPPWEMWRREKGASESAARSDRTHAQFMHFIRGSGLYPSCDRGHLNLYQAFLERSLSLTRRGGRIGLILPWGFATDDGAAQLRARLMGETALETIVGLDNAAALFPIHRGTRFLVLVASAGGSTREMRARFGVTTANEVDDLPAHDEPGGADAYPVRLAPSCLFRLSGPARRIPDVRRPAILALAERLCTEFPALGDPASFGCQFGRELNATEARRHFGSEGLPVLEGKHVLPFQVRPDGQVFIRRDRALRLLPDARFERPRLVYRDVSAVGNRLSLIAAIVPAGTVTTHTVFCLRSRLPDNRQQFLCGLFNSYVLNALVRLLMGGHLTTSLVEGLPAPMWNGDDDDTAIAALARQLTGMTPPTSAHAELQARVAARYGLGEPELREVLAGFPLVPAADRQQVLDAFSRLARSRHQSFPRPKPPSLKPSSLFVFTHNQQRGDDDG